LHDLKRTAVKEMIPFWSAIVVAVLTVFVGPFLRGEFDNRRLHRTLQYAELRSKLAGGSEHAKMLDSLLTLETTELVQKERIRLGRKLKARSLLVLLLIALGGGAATYAMVSFALVEANPYIVALKWMTAGFIAVGAVLMANGWSDDLFEPRAPRTGD
jgi:hypothetical protein